MDDYLIYELQKTLVIGVKQTLTTQEAALYTGMSYMAFMHRINEIPHYKPGKMLYFDKKDLDDWMHQNKIVSDNDIMRKASILCQNKT